MLVPTNLNTTISKSFHLQFHLTFSCGGMGDLPPGLRGDGMGGDWGVGFLALVGVG